MIVYKKLDLTKCFSCGKETTRGYQVTNPDGELIIELCLCGPCCNVFATQKLRDLKEARDKFRDTNWKLRHKIKKLREQVLFLQGKGDFTDVEQAMLASYKPEDYE